MTIDHNTQNIDGEVPGPSEYIHKKIPPPCLTEHQRAGHGKVLRAQNFVG